MLQNAKVWNIVFPCRIKWINKDFKNTIIDSVPVPAVHSLHKTIFFERETISADGSEKHTHALLPPFIVKRTLVAYDERFTFYLGTASRQAASLFKAALNRLISKLTNCLSLVATLPLWEMTRRRLTLMFFHNLFPGGGENPYMQNGIYNRKRH